MRSAHRLAALCALVPAVLAASASATHDTAHPFAGNWTTTFEDAPRSGTMSFRLVSDAAGEEAMTALGVPGGNRCPTPSDYYVGPYTRGDERGRVAACTLQRSGGAHTLAGWFRSDRGSAIGFFAVDTREGRTTFDGSYRPPGGTPPNYGGGPFPFKGTFAGHFDGDGASAEERITVKEVEGLVKVREPGGVFRPLRAGDVIPRGSEIRTYDGGFASIRMPTNDFGYAAVWFVYRFSAVLLARDGGVRVLVGRARFVDVDLVRGGSVVLGVMGTTYSFAYDAIAKTTVVSVASGRVRVTPTNARLSPVVLGPGQEVQVTPRSRSSVARIGYAGAPRGAVSRDRARQLVERIVDRSKRRCRARGTAFTQATIPRGWRISLRFTGRFAGWATWNVRGRRATAANELAARLTRGCRPSRG